MTDEADSFFGFVEAAARIEKSERHELPAVVLLGPSASNLIRSLRRPALRRLSDIIPLVASDRVMPVIAWPSTCTGMPVKTW
ncbi:protein of unknown function [Aminobacter niigataensis]|nr:protein of unknown function [Aminobacter niigataensis]